MKPVAYLLSCFLFSSAMLATEAAPAEPKQPFKIIKITKNSSGETRTKNQPGPSGIEKGSKEYADMVADAQKHLKPKIVHTPKEEASHEE